MTTRCPCCRRTVGATWLVVVSTVSLLLGVCSSVDSSLRFIHEPADTVVPPGAGLTLHCQVDPQSAGIRWRYNQELITSDTQGVVEGSMLHVAPDQLPHKTSHLGEYTCEASTEHGRIISRSATIQRAVLGHFPSGSDVRVNATEGNTAVINCVLPKGVPTTRSEFIINNVTIISQSTGRYHILPSGNLQIEEVKPSDAGQYLCVAINPVSNQRRNASHVTHLRVIAPWTNSPAHIIKSPAPHSEVIKGHNVTLECVVEGAPVPHVTWQKYGGRLPDTSTTVLSNLVLTDVQLVDEGTYICRAENGVGPPQAAIARVKVLDPPHILSPPDSQVVKEGSSVTFTCMTQGHPKVKTEWLHNGQALESVDSNISMTDSSLTIHAVRESDVGMYQCIAHSKLGSTHAEAALMLQDPNDKDTSPNTLPHEMQHIAPDSVSPRDHGEAPSDVKTKPSTSPSLSSPSQEATLSSEDDDDEEMGPNRRRDRGRAPNNKPKGPRERSEDTVLVPPSRPRVTKLSDTSVMLEWTVPDNDGLPITFFKVQYKEVSDDRRRRGWRTIDEDIPASSRQHEVPGLRPGGTYRFRVLAVYSNNDNKQGPNSARFTLRVEPAHRPHPPESEPMIVNARPVSHDAIAITWQYLPVEPSPIEGFFIFYKPYTSPEDAFVRQTVLGPLVRQHVITGLLADTEYSLKMQSFNAAGASLDSYTVVKKTLSLAESPGKGTSLPEFDPHSHASSSTPSAPPDVFPSNRVSTQSSSEMLYLVLGVVLGIMMIILLIFMALCGWKQRQQRRMMAAAMNSDRSKYSDPSRSVYSDPARTIYTDSLRKPVTNGTPFLLNGVNHITSNGRAPTHSPPQPNITINPLTQLEQPPNLYPSLHNKQENIPCQEYSSLRSLRSNHSNTHPSKYYHGDQGIYEETEFYTPPHHGSAQVSADDVSTSSREHNTSNLSTFRTSHDYIPQSHDPQYGRSNDPSKNWSYDPAPPLPPVRDYSPMCGESHETHMLPSNHHRQHYHHSPHESPLQRDMATNTELSNHDGMYVSDDETTPSLTTYNHYDCVAHSEEES